jgi:hypothetical protein
MWKALKRNSKAGACSARNACDILALVCLKKPLKIGR